MNEPIPTVPPYATIMQAAIVHATLNLPHFGSVERAYLSDLSFQITELPIWYVALHFEGFDKVVTMTVTLQPSGEIEAAYLSEGPPPTVLQVAEAHRKHIVLLERGQNADNGGLKAPWLVS